MSAWEEKSRLRMFIKHSVVVEELVGGIKWRINHGNIKSNLEFLGWIIWKSLYVSRRLKQKERRNLDELSRMKWRIKIQKVEIAQENWNYSGKYEDFPTIRQLVP
jgi:hypothetical protein